MSGRRPWVLLVGLMVVLAVLVALTTPRRGGASPDHESTSDAVDGTSALRAYAEALGYRTSALEGEFQLTGSPGLLFVFSPLPQSGYSAAQAGQLRDWVSAGGVLVYASEAGDPQLDQALALRRRPQTVSAAAAAPAPVLGGLGQVHGADQAQPFRGQATQVPILRHATGDVLGVTMAVGRGRVVALADPLVLCNGYLSRPDNGRLAADLLAMAPPGGAVLFDEYHHGAQSGGSSPTAWLSTAWGVALVWAVVILVVGLAIRGRAFGPRLPLQRGGARSSAEYATAVGGLLRRAGARAVTLDTLDAATRRQCAERLGLSGEPRAPVFMTVLQRRAPSLGGALGEVEARLPEAARSDAVLLQVAHRLHELAFPATEPAERRPA